MNPELAQPTLETLTLIWQRVFHRQPIASIDSFFELGGDNHTALQIVTAIAELCGREISPFILYRAPTISALADYLAQPAPPKFSPLILLRPGAVQPPVFITHGMGGNVMDFFQLLQLVQSDRPIYGIQARGSDGADPPLDRIEDLAQYNLDAIRQLQPHGPYFLIGYSFGGVVTLEMAQRLAAAGEKIALLAMLDAYPHSRQLSAQQRLRLLLRQFKRHLSILAGLPPRKAFRYLRYGSERRLYDALNLRGAPGERISGEPRLTPAMQRMRDASNLALSRYRPRFYNGQVKFVTSEIKSVFPRDPSAAWAPWVSKFELTTVPGDHHGILTTHYDALASALSAFLRDADASLE